jgi:hypothetical protein
VVAKTKPQRIKDGKDVAQALVAESESVKQEHAGNSDGDGECRGKDGKSVSPILELKTPKSREKWNHTFRDFSSLPRQAIFFSGRVVRASRHS